MQKIQPFLWFDTQAEEAATYYTSLFNDARITNISRYGDAGPGKLGSVMMVNFQLEGQDFMALNGGPVYKINQAISFFVNCESQSEVDHLWDALSDGGEILQCGWLVDKFGVTWQIVPTKLGELLGDEDPIKAGRVMEAMLKMKKIDTAELLRAYNQE